MASHLRGKIKGLVCSTVILVGLFLFWGRFLGDDQVQLTREEVLEKASEYNVKFIRLQFTDILGRFKNIAITVEELERALKGYIKFDSSVIEGFLSNKQSDIYLYPDASTFVIFP